MRISVRFALALTLVGLVGSGLQAAIGLARTDDEIRSTLEGEALMLGESLRVAFVHALRDRQLADVTETLAELEEIAPHVDIGLFDPAGRLQAETIGGCIPRSARGSPSWCPTSPSWKAPR
jgi:hypothetical protein